MSLKTVADNLLSYTLTADWSAHNKQEGRSHVQSFSCLVVCSSWRKMYASSNMYHLGVTKEIVK